MRSRRAPRPRRKRRRAEARASLRSWRTRQPRRQLLRLLLLGGLQQGVDALLLRLGFLVAGAGGRRVPDVGLEVVLRHAEPFRIELAQARLRFRIAGLRERPEARDSA